jgi:hypothetical protein
MFKRFRIVPFVIGLAIGYAILVLYKPERAVVHEYPHPDTVKDTVYKDRKGRCYSYTATEVDCDANEGTLKQYPLV